MIISHLLALSVHFTTSFPLPKEVSIYAASFNRDDVQTLIVLRAGDTEYERFEIKFIKTCPMILIPVSTNAILHIEQQYLIDHESWENNSNNCLAITLGCHCSVRH